MTHHLNGYLSIDGEVAKLREYFINESDKTLRHMVKKMRSKCLHCERIPRMVRRGLIEIPNANVRGMVFHMDYLSIEGKYIFVLIDDLSREILLQYADTCDARIPVRGVLVWKAYFGLKKNCVIVSDNGSHFTHRIWGELHRIFKTRHHFSIQYSPWTNGSAENANGPVVRCLKTLMSQYGLERSEWPELLPMIPIVLNNRPNVKLGGISANEIYIGRGIDEKNLLFGDGPGHDINVLEVMKLPSVKTGLSENLMISMKLKK